MLWFGYCLAGLASGLLGGIFGVGGGLIMVPIFVYLLHLQIHDATATSMAVIIFVGISATVQQMITRPSQIHWGIVIPVAIFAIAGAILGVRLKGIMSGEVLQRSFAVLLFLVALRIWFTSGK